MLFARFILGTLAAGIVWISIRPTESVNIEYAVLAGISAFAAAACGSWLSLKKHERRKIAPVVFSAPFAVLAAVSAPALVGGSWRAVVMWALCTIGAFAFSVISDLIAFRRIVDEEEA